MSGALHPESDVPSKSETNSADSDTELTCSPFFKAQAVQMHRLVALSITTGSR